MVTAYQQPTFLDFFAGSGLVSEGLKELFEPIWANDICEKKATVFCTNHSQRIFHLGSIENIHGQKMPYATLAWGSFPCQDLSLAGSMKGLENTRSGLLWQWLRIIDEMKKKPPLIAAENVTGLISASNGEHYRNLHAALVDRGYKVGAVVIDAAYWVPQSRKRVFVIAVKSSLKTHDYESKEPIWCHPASLVKVVKDLKNWVWWSLPEPSVQRKSLEEIIDMNATCDSELKRDRLFQLIPPKHKERIIDAVEKGQQVFPGYKRIRNGKQVLELRFDGLAGCLRTPEGGSSRQFLVIKSNGSFKTRLLTVKETAALMGAPHYKLPGSYNDGYKAMGDAVVVPVSRFLAERLLYPLAIRAQKGNKK